MEQIKSAKLKNLKPGDMFRRAGDNCTFRYIVSSRPPDSVNDIYCYNLDGPTEGYGHPINEDVVLIHGTRPISPEPPTRFWMCWVENSGMPTIRHPQLGMAQCEAERLAKQTGKKVFILVANQAITYEAPKSPVFTYEATKEKF